MSWQTPKTNWTARDFFDLDPDLLRLGGNLAFLKKEAAGVLGVQSSAAPALPRLGETADPALLNGIEKNTAELAAVCSAEFLPHRDFLPGDAFWSWRDLNRIEGAMKEVRAALGSIRAAQPMLSFTLGGDFFGA